MMNKQERAAQLFETRNGITFLECLMATSRTDFPTYWQRLHRKQLFATSPIERMIDEATGYDTDLLEEYIDDVYNVVFLTYYNETSHP